MTFYRNQSDKIIRSFLYLISPVKDNEWLRYGCRTFQKDFEEENFPAPGRPIHFRGHFNHKWWVVQKMQIEFSDFNGIGLVENGITLG